MGQFTMTDRNTAKSTAYTLQTKTVAFVMLWLWSADDQAFAKNPPPSEQLSFTNLNRWESINFPSVRIPFEDGKVRSNLWINVWIHPAGTGLDVSVTGWTGSLGSSPPSIDGGNLILRLHRLTGEIIESKVLNSGSALGFSRGGYVDWGFYYSFPRATNPRQGRNDFQSQVHGCAHHR